LFLSRFFTLNGDGIRRDRRSVDHGGSFWRGHTRAGDHTLLGSGDAKHGQF
jgi:hypothetical protein